MTRIVVVEDNAPLAFGLRNNLEIENYQVEVVGDGAAAIQVIERRPPDLIVLDLMLPGMDGFRVLRTVRERGCRAPVLILTALGREEDKVRGLKLGADDYVTKPFGILELLARVEALIRRGVPRANLGAREPARIGPLMVDPEARVATIAGRPIDLSPKEFELLWWLIEAKGAAVSRSDLMVRVWGYQADVLSRTVDTHVAELRRKLGDDAGEPRFIHTVRKVGYRLTDQR